MITLDIKFIMTFRLNFRVLSSTEHLMMCVCVIDITIKLRDISMTIFLTIQFSEMFNLNGLSFSFLIKHSSLHNLIFDLNIRKNWKNLPVLTVKRMKFMDIKADVQMGVWEQLEVHGVNVKIIEMVI